MVSRVSVLSSLSSRWLGIDVTQGPETGLGRVARQGGATSRFPADGIDC